MISLLQYQQTFLLINSGAKMSVFPVNAHLLQPRAAHIRFAPMSDPQATERRRVTGGGYLLLPERSPRIRRGRDLPEPPTSLTVCECQRRAVRGRGDAAAPGGGVTVTRGHLHSSPRRERERKGEREREKKRNHTETTRTKNVFFEALVGY